MGIDPVIPLIIRNKNLNRVKNRIPEKKKDTQYLKILDFYDRHYNYKYLVKNIKGRSLHFTLTSLFIMGFINLYLIFQFNDLIILPAIYFVFQSLLQLLLLVALIDEARRN